MTDYPIALDGLPVTSGLNLKWGAPFAANIWSVGVVNAPPPPIVVFKMRGMDASSGGLYDTWLSTQSPDYSGEQYHGTLAKPLRDVVVVDSWGV